MNKKGKTNWIAYVLIGLLIAFAVFYMTTQKEEKQKPHPADISQQEEGTPSVRLKDSQGREGEMIEDFYKVTGIVGSMIRGTTSVTCTTDSDCTGRCGGDSFCENNIDCYDGRCTYTNIVEIALDAKASNTGTSNLGVTFSSVTDGDTGTSAFEDSHVGNVGDTVQVDSGTTHTFSGLFFDLSPYEGKTTDFTVSMYAEDLYSGVRIPSSGTIDSTVSLVIGADPTGGFSVQISQLPGI